ncbi:ABC transporter ATP-binding protein [Faecalicatena orotica]|uniref:ABC-2 type transport system ATP-binding protein n=1 Tax=Faecalicatena orotica TaxID=1544 RepID=A0A2Y9C6B3_9FIRM|nr:ABC transporter ATP-binding protein [Faecalicatena orotica]PWJ23083.1 ABC-2 type transport system ATP-binding protein [Faecalicatena orotica]SSA57819.1 ABC-2 type transport system ATP-binding protein [Faecalicatena orotica]
MNILEIEGLRKKFGAHQVLDGLNIVVPEHSVFGFLGKNGAGKTTTMKIVLGLLKADAGEVRVLGEKVEYGQTSTNRFVGYLPDVPEFYSYMTPKEYLRLCGRITGMTDKQIMRKSEELLELTGLKGVKKRIGGFSRGMKQRLGIAQALFNEPKLLICDEPTSALDPVGRREVLDIMEQVREKTTVIFSTHVLSDVERICDRVAVLNDGKTVMEGTLGEIKERHRKNSLLIEFTRKESMDRFMEEPLFRQLLKQSKREGSQIIIHTKDIEQAEAEIIRGLNETRLMPSRLEILEPSLEGLFMEAIQ